MIGSTVGAEVSRARVWCRGCVEQLRNDRKASEEEKLGSECASKDTSRKIELVRA